MLAGRPDRPAPNAEAKPLASAGTTATKPATTSDISDRVRLIYQVKRGDTLLSVARQYQTSVASLKQWNRLSGDILTPGARLMIFAPKELQYRKRP
jgi:LysM repeat protein